ncbi:MAG: hypothetical protein L0215_11595 [Gemmataceae bacterium]|nr:hypothetical protein [Gemmataceae bacterium]
MGRCLRRHLAGNARAGATRRRRLNGFARYPETPKHLLIELDAAGSDYAVLAENAADEVFVPAFDTLREVLLQSPTPLTREEIRQAWPIHLARPVGNTLWRWLSRACTLGLHTRFGAGSKVDPFRYALAAMEKQEDAA